MRTKSTKPILQVSDVTFSYPEFTVLRDVSFSLNKGDFAAFIGANGAGKSTLFDLILGNKKADKGEIVIMGQPLKEFCCWHKIGYVPQLKQFNQGFPATVFEIVATGLYSELGLFGRISASHKERIKAALKAVDMLEYSHRLIGQLSGGQQQRVMIAKVLAANAELILLDEPSAGIDSCTAANISALLSKLNKERNITIAIITHDLPKIVAYTNRVFSINNFTLQEISHEHHSHISHQNIRSEI